MEKIAAAGKTPPALSAQRAERKPELLALTGLRFFAAIYVVFYHFVFPNLHTSISPLRNALGVGYSAVGFFFVLSGFVLTYSYVPANGRVVIDRLSFWKARLSRIYPAYLFAFLLAAPFQILGSIHVNGLRVAVEKLTVGSVLVLTLLQAWTPWTVWYWNIPAWSLSAEMFFYFCFPFAALIVGRLRPRNCLIAAVGIWLLGLIGPAVYCALQRVVAEPPFPLAQLAIETNPIMRLPDFLIGMLIGRIFSAGFRLKQPVASILSVTGLAILGLLLCTSSVIPRLLISNGVLVPISALLVFALAHQFGLLAKVLSHPAMKALGEASYAIYILQFPVSYLFNLNDRTFTALRFSIYLVALISISVVTFFYIELPLKRHLRSLRVAKKQSLESKSEERPFATQVAVEA
jgi:peptidoglycan/LPS O-acetylase OafA/YrhL